MSYLSQFTPQIDKLFQIIKNNQSFLIVGHSRPDGDCLGSMLGLGKRLEKQGKQASYCASRGHSASMSRIPGSEQIQYYCDNPDFTLPKTEVVIFVDHSKPSAHGDMEEYIKTYCQDKISCCIDHHHSNRSLTPLDLIDISSSSCCELIREIITLRESEYNLSLVSPEIATLCYIGLTTDTGGTVGLEYEKDSIRSHENALSMLRAGADKKTVIKKLNTVTLEQLQFAKLLFERMRFSKHCLWIWYEGKEADVLGLDAEQSKLAFRMMKNTSGIKVVIKFVRQDTGRYVSIRTATNFNVRQIAEHFGGGGHDLASGCKFPYPDRTVQDIEKTVGQIDDLVDGIIGT